MAPELPPTTRKRALELGAAFIQNDLDKMRTRAREQFEHARRVHGDEWDGREFPVTSSVEGDLLKAVEWASAIATLRAMAAQEDPK
jgi:hypothetical protein